jgi:hypothetical protein
LGFELKKSLGRKKFGGIFLGQDGKKMGEGEGKVSSRNTTSTTLFLLRLVAGVVKIICNCFARPAIFANALNTLSNSCRNRDT